MIERSVLLTHDQKVIGSNPTRDLKFQVSEAAFSIAPLACKVFVISGHPLVKRRSHVLGK